MEKIILEADLLQVTGNLSATIVSTKQLSQLRADLVNVLKSQPVTDIFAPKARSLQDVTSVEATISKDTLDNISELVSGVEPSTTDETFPSDIKVFRREVPVITSQNSASVPKWAAGREISYTLGPFSDNVGRLFWFDFYRFKRQIKVARGNAGAVFLTIPITGFLTSKNSYSLDKGSIWFVSSLLATTAPVGSFTGLKIQRGQINITGAVAVSGDTIVIGANDTCTLEIELDQPSDVPAIDTNTGDDAKQMNIVLPSKVTFVFNSSNSVLTNSADMSLKVYGQEYQFTFYSQNCQYDSLINRILIPFSANSTEVEILSVQSGLFVPEQKAALKLSAWALSTTLTGSIDQLGDASGIGAICLITSEGLRARWKGLENRIAKLNTSYLITEPGRIALTAAQASVRNGKQQFELWQENNSHKKIRSLVNLSYPKQFSIQYNCLSNGNEMVLFAELSSEFSIDRPLRADTQRLKIHTDKTEFGLIETKSVDRVAIQAIDVLQRLIINKLVNELYPISFALSNAFIKTTPIDDLYLIGVLDNERDINNGSLVLVCHIENLLLSLPDPYVSSYKAFENIDYQRSGNYTNGYGRTSSTTGISLASLIQWSTIDTPLVSFMFLQTNAQDLQVALSLPERPIRQPISISRSVSATNTQNPSTINQDPLTYAESRIGYPQIQSVREEDEQNSRNLRNYFNEALRSAQEQIYMLDVSTNADLLGVGLNIFGGRSDYSRASLEANTNNLPFKIVGIDLSAYATNVRLYTLPEIQWEPIETIQNPDVKPYPFPSPATSPDTGDPTLIGTTVYELVPIAPRPVVDKIVNSYNDKANPSKVAGLFTLPFGMKAAALWDNASDKSKQGASISFNQPKFEDAKVEGGIQIAVIATTPDVGDTFETAGFKGATIQTRNLIELLTGNIPLDDEGKPLSVLGPVVDTIFNSEFKPGGASSRVPVERIDFSGYGATLFSNWLNPNAAIAATSQARFDVWIGRTSHEIIQVKSILYPWGVPVVRTITIQRTSGGGVTRYDSGWKAQGAGVYDFSYYVVDTNSGIKTKVPNPFEFHPGNVKGVYNITGIRDTGRIYRKPGGTPSDDVIMQEVFFDTDVLIEDVILGSANGFVPSKKQRGFVQLSPYQKPLSPSQFYELLQTEGSLGGPLDCVVNVGMSGQPMRIIKVDVNGVQTSGSSIFVSAGHGSLQLPREGSWSLVKRKENTNEIISLNEDSALPLIREGKLNTVPSQPYRFANPVDIKSSSTPVSDYGLLHSTGSQKVLFLRPTIQRNDANIKSSLRPYFADSFAILGSVGIFPNTDTTFQLGTSGTNLQIDGPGLLKLTSGGNFKAPVGYTRDLLNNGGSRIYVDYSDVAGSGDTSDVSYSFDSQAPVPWSANLKRHSIVVDLAGFEGLVTVSTEFNAAADKRPEMPMPKTKFGSILQPIIDLMRFLGDFDMGQAFAVSMGNAAIDSWQPKWKASLIGFKLEFEAPSKLEIKVFNKKIKSVPQVPGAKSPIKIEVEIEIETYYNMLPFSIKSDDSSVALAEEAAMMLSVGASLKLGGTLKILCTTIGAVDLYFVGLVEFEFGIDLQEGKSFGFKVAVGLELSTEWPIVGEVAIMMAIGLEMEWKDSGSGVFVILIFKGEAELLGGLIVIGIGIEAKGGQETENDAGVEKTFGICEVEFSAEVTLAFVIHFEFDVTWQEKKQLS